MKIRLHLERNGVSPSLRGAVRNAGNARPALRAGGEAVVSMAVRAFTNPAFRPAPWAPLADSTLAARARRGRKGTLPLQDSTALRKSLRVVSADNRSVTVGSDRKAGAHSLAAIHQLGAPRARIPARPFFPVTAAGELTPQARRRFHDALRRALGVRA